MASIDLSKLLRKLKYTFNNGEILKQALTHCSVSKSFNNERLEFLGDSILNFVIAHELFKRFPEQTEGQLSRLRAHLVKGDTLAAVANEINLGDFLYLGQGELKSGGFRRTSILADALEAVIAAVYMDGGIEESRQLIVALFEKRLDPLHLQENVKDAKTQLQEYLQAHKHPLPEYELVKTEGEEHQQIFYIICALKSLKLVAEGCASNRRKAEQVAAQKILDQLFSNNKR